MSFFFSKIFSIGSRERDLNPRPELYESPALPLSYPGQNCLPRPGCARGGAGPGLRRLRRMWPCLHLLRPGRRDRLAAPAARMWPCLRRLPRLPRMWPCLPRLPRLRRLRRLPRSGARQSVFLHKTTSGMRDSNPCFYLGKVALNHSTNPAKILFILAEALSGNVFFSTISSFDAPSGGKTTTGSSPFLT